MAKMDLKLKKVQTPEFRVSFPHLREPKAFKNKKGEESKPKFSIAMLFDKKTDLSKMKEAAMNAAIEEWGSKEEIPRDRDGKICIDWGFRDGSKEKPDMDGYKGTIFVNAKAKPGNRPTVLDRKKNEIVGEDIDDQLYAGCYARAILIAYAYDMGKEQGIGWSLQHVQKLRDGEKFSGKPAAEKEFDDVEDDEGDKESDYSDDDDMGF